MKQELDNLVAELCAFDTELAKDPALVGRLVEELTRSKPTVVIDDVFRAKLRASLLATKLTPAPRQVPWWLLYTAPLGIVALMLVLVRPTLAPAPDVAEPTTPVAPADAVMKMSPTVHSDAYSSDVPMEAQQRTFMVSAPSDYFTALVAMNSINVSYLTISRPGYIVVTDDTADIIAVSDLIDSGEKTDYAFASSVPLVPGKVYTAMLYYDNGDGDFSKDSDEVATDVDGKTVSVTLMLP